MSQTRAIWGVLPIKTLNEAKQRLAGAYPPGLRRQLAAVMAEDVLSALSGAARLAGIMVVTVDPQAASLAARYGARVFSDHADGGQTSAVMAAAAALAREGAEGMLAVPGDIPGITSAEIDALIDLHPQGEAFSIVPAHDRRGSNAILMTPPTLMALSYGNDSFLPHLAAARQLGLEPGVHVFAGIGLDVDNPVDLAALARQPWQTRTHAFLRASGVFPDAEKDGMMPAAE